MTKFFNWLTTPDAYGDTPLGLAAVAVITAASLFIIMWSPTW